MQEKTVMATSKRNNKKIVSFYLTDKNYEVLESYCYTHKKSKSEVVNDMLTKFAKKHEKLNEDYKNLLKENNITIK